MEAKEKKSKQCKTCVHFKNQQMLLNYDNSTGFCTNPELAFNTRQGRMIGVVDCENLRDRTKLSGNPAHDFETKGTIGQLKPSRYLLQVEECFGCIFHEPN